MTLFSAGQRLSVLGLKRNSGALPRLRPRISVPRTPRAACCTWPREMWQGLDTWSNEYMNRAGSLMFTSIFGLLYHPLLARPCNPSNQSHLHLLVYTGNYGLVIQHAVPIRIRPRGRHFDRCQQRRAYCMHYHPLHRQRLRLTLSSLRQSPSVTLPTPSRSENRLQL